MRSGMAAAARARGWVPRPAPQLLLLLPAVCAASRGLPAAAGVSLHPPYFNLAEAARIWATATCGEPEPGGARPRPELYCKLVGGPTAPGRGHTIQVKSGERARGGGEPWTGSVPARVSHKGQRNRGAFSPLALVNRATGKGSLNSRVRWRPRAVRVVSGE